MSESGQPRLASRQKRSMRARSAIGSRAVLITGPSGCGGYLALRLLDRGFELVSDDQTIVKRDGDRLVAAPPNIAGKPQFVESELSRRKYVGDMPIGLIIELTSEIERMPD